MVSIENEMTLVKLLDCIVIYYVMLLICTNLMTSTSLLKTSGMQTTSLAGVIAVLIIAIGFFVQSAQATGLLPSAPAQICESTVTRTYK